MLKISMLSLLCVVAFVSSSQAQGSLSGTPTYGNYCGAGWCAGTSTGGCCDFGASAVDDLDAACRAHDRAYANFEAGQISWGRVVLADRALASTAGRIVGDPTASPEKRGYAALTQSVMQFKESFETQALSAGTPLWMVYALY